MTASIESKVSDRHVAILTTGIWVIAAIVAWARLISAYRVVWSQKDWYRIQSFNDGLSSLDIHQIIEHAIVFISAIYISKKVKMPELVAFWRVFAAAIVVDLLIFKVFGTLKEPGALVVGVIEFSIASTAAIIILLRLLSKEKHTK